MPEHPVDVVSQITADHTAVHALFADRDAGRGDPAETLQVIVRELALHAGAEELVVYPVVEARVPDGEALNNTDLAQHQALKEVLVRLDGADPSLDSTRRDVAEAKRLVDEHVRHEETVVLPKLAAVLDDAERAELGDAFLQTKAKAPTHPHPHAPNRPPLNKVADSAAALLDKARDAVHSIRTR